MNNSRKIRKWLKKFLLIDSIDRNAESEFWKMRRLYARGGLINRYRAKRIEKQLQLKYVLTIPCSAIIGDNFRIRHPQGIIIGRTTEIGNDCKVYPYFVAMAALKGDDYRFSNHIRRHPKIGNDCILGAKATVIGPITIGDDVTIGACAIVTKDVPSHSVVKGTNNVRRKRPEEIPEKYMEEYLKEEANKNTDK